MPSKIRAYYYLAKPGIIYGNLYVAIGAFLYGEILRINFAAMAGIIIGTICVIGSGCVLNNYLDRNIDKRMKRTEKRALVTGRISHRSALIYAVVLAVIGIISLLLLTNVLTTVIGLFGLVSYAFIYTYAKRYTVHGTLIGTVPGAVAPVAGYTAATNTLDASALFLFLILVFWQMVHFYAIAIFRMKDYKKAGIPVMPIVHGIFATKVQMLIYSCFLLLALVGLAYFGYAGLFFLAVMLPLCLWWSIIIVSGLTVEDNDAWARKVFGMSLFILLALSFCLAINAWVP